MSNYNKELMKGKNLYKWLSTNKRNQGCSHLKTLSFGSLHKLRRELWHRGLHNNRRVEARERKVLQHKGFMVKEVETNRFRYNLATHANRNLKAFCHQNNMSLNLASQHMEICQVCFIKILLENNKWFNKVLEKVITLQT